MNKFEHAPPNNEYVLYIAKDGKNLAIKYEYSYDTPEMKELDPYAATEPQSVISLSSIENATKSESLLSFVQWVNKSKAVFELFLKEHNIELDDIKFLILAYKEPIEVEDPTIKLSYFIK